MLKHIFTVICWFACCFTGLANTGKGIVQGVVTDKNNQGIPEVAVAIHQKVYAVTDAKGNYTFSVSPGTYQLSFTHLQFKTATGQVTINENKTARFSVILEEAVFDLDQVLVAGSATSRELKKLSSSISVVNSSDPEYQGVKTIDEALGRVPGVIVDRSRGLGTTGSHTVVSLRGTNAANRTLIMKDGIPLNNAYTGGVSIWSTMASNSISRMEIVRGATSSLYGTSAMGGIINLVTEDPKKLTLGGGVQYGTWNTGIYNFKIGKTFDKGFGFILFAEYKHSDGYDYMDDEQWKDYYQAPKVNLLNTTAKLFYNFKNASRLEFIADYHLDKNEMGTSTYYDEKGHTGNFLLRYNSSRTHQITYDLSVYSDRSWNKTDAVKWNTTTEAFDTPYYLTDVPYGKTGIVGQVNAALGVHTLTLGTDIRFYDLESEYTYTGSGDRNYEGKQNFYSVFLNDEISLGKYFDASLGLRYDYWKNKDGKFFDNTSGEDITINYPTKSSDALSPKIGLAFHANDQLRLRTSLSSGFKAPSIYYLYRSAPHGSNFDLGNPDLEPEKMTYSYEIGGDYYLTDKLEISATYYISQFKDFLDKIVVPQDEVPDYFNPGEGVIVNKSINIGKVGLQGVETSVRYHITPELVANLGYTWSTSEIKKYEVDEELEGNELDNSPHNLLNIGLHFDKPKWFSAGIWFKYVEEQFSDLENTEEKKLDGYQLVDFNFSKSFLKDKLTFSLTINNLFDKKYLTYYSSASTYYNGPSRSFTGGISYNF